MADNQQSPLGRNQDYHFAPGALYVNTSAGFVPAGYTGATGTGTALGKTGAFEVSIPTTYAEQTSIQTGVEADDFAISGQKVEFKTMIKECSMDILEQLLDTIQVQRDSQDEVIRHGIVGKTGLRKRANAIRMTYVEIVEGVEKWDDPALIWDFPVAVVLNADTSFNIDAETFRELPVMFRILPSRTETFYGKPVYLLSRLAAA